MEGMTVMGPRLIGQEVFGQDRAQLGLDPHLMGAYSWDCARAMALTKRDAERCKRERTESLRAHARRLRWT